MLLILLLETVRGFFLVWCPCGSQISAERCLTKEEVLLFAAKIKIPGICLFAHTYLRALLAAMLDTVSSPPPLGAPKANEPLASLISS